MITVYVQFEVQDQRDKKNLKLINLLLKELPTT